MIDRKVGIFWDYENCHPSTALNGCKIANNIRAIALQFGSITSFNAYVDCSLDNGSKGVRLQSELQASGVSIKNCPHVSRKEIVDRALTVDMLVFAFDSSSLSTVVLITGDNDFTYAASTLRMRGHKIVHIAPETHSNASLLEENVDVRISWNDLVSRPTQLSTFHAVWTGLPQPRAHAIRQDSSLLCAAEPVSPDNVEDDDIVMVARRTSAISVSSSISDSSDDSFSSVRTLAMSPSPSESEWLFIEELEDNLDLRENKGTANSMVDFGEERFSSALDIVTKETQTLSTEIIAVDLIRKRSASIESASTATLFEEKDRETTLDDLMTANHPGSSTTSQEGCQGIGSFAATNALSPICKSVTQNSPKRSSVLGSKRPIVQVAKSAVPPMSQQGPPVAVPVEFQCLVNALRKGGYVNGESVEFSKLVPLIPKTIYKGQGGAKKYLQKAQAAHLVVISGSQEKDKFTVMLSPALI